MLVFTVLTHTDARTQREGARTLARRYTWPHANMPPQGRICVGRPFRGFLAIALYACRAKSQSMPQMQLTAEAVGGVTVMSDLLAIATLHISIFYSLAARWHGLQVPPPLDAGLRPSIYL